MRVKYFSLLADFKKYKLKKVSRNKEYAGIWEGIIRKPNYFGELLFWPGTFIVNFSVGITWTIVSPLALTVLVFNVAVIPDIIKLKMKICSSKSKPRSDFISPGEDSSKKYPPSSAYHIYCNEKMKKIYDENPRTDHKDIFRNIAEQWQKLGQEEKKVYKDQYEKQKLEYEQNANQTKTSESNANKENLFPKNFIYSR